MSGKSLLSATSPYERGVPPEQLMRWRREAAQLYDSTRDSCKYNSTGGERRFIRQSREAFINQSVTERFFQYIQEGTRFSTADEPQSARDPQDSSSN